MKNINIQLIHVPDFDVPAMIGGLAKLTQLKREFEPTSHEEGVRLMKKVVELGHTSLLECADFGFVFGSTSRVFLAQITRHRVASYMSGSQQYQDHDDFPYVVPASILNNAEAMAEYLQLMSVINTTYKALKPLVGKDDARYVLPGAAANHLYAKFNLREIVGPVMTQRICRRNTPESLHNVRTMIQLMVARGYEECVRLGGCACVTEGRCDQGKMCCGSPYGSWHEMVYGDDDETVRTRRSNDSSKIGS